MLKLKLDYPPQTIETSHLTLFKIKSLDVSEILTPTYQQIPVLKKLEF